jgi:hypothetical protein
MIQVHDQQAQVLAIMCRTSSKRRFRSSDQLLAMRMTPCLES